MPFSISPVKSAATIGNSGPGALVDVGTLRDERIGEQLPRAPRVQRGDVGDGHRVGRDPDCSR